MAFDYGIVTALFCLGLYCVMTNPNLIKIVIGINIIESALVLFLVRLAASPGDRAPIHRGDPGMQPADTFAAPILHALTLTQIVINAAVTAIMLGFVIRLYQSYRTVDLNEIRRMKH